MPGLFLGYAVQTADFQCFLRFFSKYRIDMH